MLREIKSGIYRLLHPKMTFFLTSVDRKGRPNVMTCAWATPVSDEPPMMLACVSKESYTAKLIRQTKEFVVNIPPKKLLPALWTCGKSSGRNTDKFEKANLKTVSARKVKAPVIGGCIGYLECKLWRAVEAGECYVFFGNILSAYADDRYFKKNAWTTKATLPLHLGGSKVVYFR